MNRMRQRIRGVCNQKAACGRGCTLDERRPHSWHICNQPACELCHLPHDVAERWTPAEAGVRARVDSMDVATWLLALGGLAGMWIGGMI